MNFSKQLIFHFRSPAQFISNLMKFPAAALMSIYNATLCSARQLLCLYTLLCVLFMKFFRLKTLGLFSYSHDSGKKAIKANMTALIWATVRLAKKHTKWKRKEGKIPRAQGEREKERKRSTEGVKERKPWAAEIMKETALLAGWLVGLYAAAGINKN